MPLMANAGLVERTASDAPEATARLVSIVLDGLRASAATTPAAPPVDESVVLTAMRRGCAG